MGDNRPMAFSFTYPTPLPSTKGWGQGYPNCQDVARQGRSTTFWPGVHRDIAELVGLIVAEMSRRGFKFLDPGCWGYGCRGTKSSTGSGTTTPSFHSWGLGFDVNAPLNVFGADREDTQLGKPEFAWVVMLWREYGFYWLGPAIGDWMHFSFVGSPADAVAMTKKAREALGGDVSAEMDELVQGIANGRAGKPLPDSAGKYERAGWALGNSDKKQGERITKLEAAPPGGGLQFGDEVKLTKPI